MISHYNSNAVSSCYALFAKSVSFITSNESHSHLLLVHFQFSVREMQINSIMVIFCMRYVIFKDPILVLFSQADETVCLNSSVCIIAKLVGKYQQQLDSRHQHEYNAMHF